MAWSEANGSLLYASVAIWNRQTFFLSTPSDSFVKGSKLNLPVQL